MKKIQETNNNFEVEKKKETIKKSSDSQLRHCIIYIKDIKNKYHLTPEQNRYVDKIVRQELNLQISKRAKKLPDYLNPSEIYIFKKICLSKKRINSVLGNLLIFTGLRISEARNLDIRDIDFANNQIKVIQGKGHKDRYVPVPSGLLEQIKSYIDNRNTGYLFINSKNKPYSIRRLQQLMEDNLKEANFNKHLSTHSLRHTFACMCISKGIKLEDIQLIMGHSSKKTTEIYAKLELGSIKNQFLQLMGEI